VNISWILLILIPVAVFAGISMLAALRRITEATQRSADQLEKLVTALNRDILL
jgi:predicted membrane-bound mannosyltransferase